MAFGDLKGTLVGGNVSIPNPLPATGSVAIAVGDLVVAVIAQQTANTSTAAADNLGNTYTAQNAGTLSTVSGRMYYSRATVAGTLTTVNFTTTASTNDAAAAVAVYTGPFVVSPIDATPTNLSADTTTPYSCPATGALAQAVELCIGWIAAASGTLTAGGGFTRNVEQITSANAYAAISSLVVSATTTQTPTWTGTAPSADVLGTASFKADQAQTTFRKTEWMGDTPAFSANREFPLSLRTWISDPQSPFPPFIPPVLMPPLIVEWGVSDRRTFEPARIQYNAALLAAPVVTPTYMPGRVVDWGSWPDPRKPLTHIDFAAALRPQGTPPPPPDTTHIPCRVSAWGMWERVPFSAAPLANLTLSLPVQAVAVTYVFREPYYSPQWVGPRFETWTASVNIALRAVPPPPRPFTQTDWPLTPAARQPDRTYQRSFPPELIGKDRLPIRQQSWPLTAAPYYDISLRTFLAINPPLLATSAPPPILMPPLIIEWGISERIPFQPAVIQYNAPLLTAPVVVPPRPFVQSDWPVPPTPQRAADLRTFINDTPIQLIGKDQLPTRQQSWPLTPATEFVNALRSIGFRSPALDVVAGRPFVQSDWPVPAAARQPDRTFQRSFPPTLVGKDRLPIRQQDWPLPIAPRPAADLRTYIAQSPIRLIGKDRLPFRQMHWPVPLAPLEFHTLRSITQGRVIYGGEVAPIPPEPPLPPPEVIHSVRAHADAYYGVFYADEIKGRADFSRAKGSNDEEAAN